MIFWLISHGPGAAKALSWFKGFPWICSARWGKMVFRSWRLLAGSLRQQIRRQNEGALARTKHALEGQETQTGYLQESFRASMYDTSTHAFYTMRSRINSSLSHEKNLKQQRDGLQAALQAAAHFPSPDLLDPLTTENWHTGGKFPATFSFETTACGDRFRATADTNGNSSLEMSSTKSELAGPFFEGQDKHIRGVQTDADGASCFEARDACLQLRWCLWYPQKQFSRTKKPEQSRMCSQ